MAFRVEYLHKLFRIFLTRDLSIFPHLFIRSFICISMNSCIFILPFGLQISAICFTSQFWSLKTLSGSYVPWHIPFQYEFFFLALRYSVIIRYFGFILHISCLSPRIRHIPNQCGSSHWRMVLEASIWMVGVFIATAIWWKRYIPAYWSL